MNIFKTVDETRDFSKGFELFKQKSQYKVYLPTPDNTDVLVKFMTIVSTSDKKENEVEDGEIENVITDDKSNKELIEMITNINYDNYNKAPKLKLTESTLTNYISEAMLEIMDFAMSNGEVNAKLEEMGMLSTQEQDEIKVTNKNRNNKEVVQQEFKKTMHDNKIKSESNVVAIADGKVVEEIDINKENKQREIAELEAKLAQLKAN